MSILLDVSLSMYYKVEQGARNPSYNFLSKFYKVFDVSIDEIFFEKD